MSEQSEQDVVPYGKANINTNPTGDPSERHFHGQINADRIMPALPHIDETPSSGSHPMESLVSDKPINLPPLIDKPKPHQQANILEDVEPASTETLLQKLRRKLSR